MVLVSLSLFSNIYRWHHHHIVCHYLQGAPPSYCLSVSTGGTTIILFVSIYRWHHYHYLSVSTVHSITMYIFNWHCLLFSTMLKCPSHMSYKMAFEWNMWSNVLSDCLALLIARWATWWIWGVHFFNIILLVMTAGRVDGGVSCWTQTASTQFYTWLPGHGRRLWCW